MQSSNTPIFKAWDAADEGGKMSEPFTFFDLKAEVWWERYHANKMVCLLEGITISKLFSNLIFLQFIGRFDKNGRMIFVGDIIKMGNKVFVLKSIEELFFNDSHFLNDGLSDPEVIGNKYENPNLMPNVV